jgi:6-phosphogluconolactonase
VSAALAKGLRGLRGEQNVSPTAEEAARLLAARLAEHLRQRLAKVPLAHLALSGGSSTQLLGSALAAESALSASEWSRIHVWMVDERCVADDDPRLNFNLVRSVLITNVPLPAGNLHPMPVLAVDGAERYEALLRAALAAGRGMADHRLDAVVLGMGPDGHTASLFPETPALDERERLVVLNDGHRVAAPRPRMTMTYPLLNRAYLIALLVTGASKSAVLAQAAANPSNFVSWPVAGVVPAAGSKLLWFLDQNAAPQDRVVSGLD